MNLKIMRLKHKLCFNCTLKYVFCMNPMLTFQTTTTLKSVDTQRYLIENANLYFLKTL